MCEAYGVPELHQQRTPVADMVHNNETQRQIKFRHMFRDIIVCFQPNKITSGYGRMDSKGRLFVNDAKHRILGGMFFGIEEFSLNYIISDDELNKAIKTLQSYKKNQLHKAQKNAYQKFKKDAWI